MHKLGRQIRQTEEIGRLDREIRYRLDRWPDRQRDRQVVSYTCTTGKLKLEPDSDRTSRLNGSHSCCRVQISARSTAILTTIFSLFSSLPPGTCWIKFFKIGHYHLLPLPNIPLFTILFSSRPCCRGVSFNKPRRQLTSSLSKTRTSKVSKVFHSFKQ
jgi:hypothetical protein